MKEYLIIVPAYNEADNIKAVLTDLLTVQKDADILVINDGSTDKTEKEVRSAGVKVLSLPYNMGYGAALQTGFKYAVKNNYSYVIQFDADGQHDSHDIQFILDKLRTEKVDIVLGSRFLEKRASTGLLKKTAIILFRGIIKVATGTNITDPSSGIQGLSQRAFACYAQMGGFPADYPDADVLIHMLLSKYKVCEIPVTIKERNKGKSMHAGLRPVFYIIKMLMSIIIVILREKRPVEV